MPARSAFAYHFSPPPPEIQIEISESFTSSSALPLRHHPSYWLSLRPAILHPFDFAFMRFSSPFHYTSATVQPPDIVAKFYGATQIYRFYAQAARHYARR